MSWPGGLFYTPAQQHWQLLLATSCMAASSFWTSRQELMPSEFPLTWATFRVQFSPNNPEEPDRNPWRNQKWKPLRYSFRWTKRAAQMHTCTCFSLDEHTLAAGSSEPGVVLGTGAHGEYSRPLQSGVSHSSRSCKSGHRCVLPSLIFFFQVFSEWIPT